MPMPHRTFAQVAKRRLIGKEGRERIREVRALLDELPDYRNGPYADLRKSLMAEIEDTRTRSSAVHRDSIAVRREGAAQVALVGPPNVGKSSLLQALSEIQIRTGDYAFTTLRPVPALTRIGGVLVQLVEIPGLIEGANEDRGGGRALLGVLRSADAIVYCARADGDPASCASSWTRSPSPGSSKPAFVAATRADEAAPGAVDAWRPPSPASPCCPCPSSTRPRSTRSATRCGGSRADPGLPPRERVDRRGAARPPPAGDGRRRGRCRPPRAGRRLHRGPGLGPVGEVRRAARRPRARGRATATSSRSWLMPALTTPAAPP